MFIREKRALTATHTLYICTQTNPSLIQLSGPPCPGAGPNGRKKTFRPRGWQRWIWLAVVCYCSPLSGHDAVFMYVSCVVFGSWYLASAVWPHRPKCYLAWKVMPRKNSVPTEQRLRHESRPKCICRGMASESPPGTSSIAQGLELEPHCCIVGDTQLQ